MVVGADEEKGGVFIEGKRFRREFEGVVGKKGRRGETNRAIIIPI